MEITTLTTDETTLFLLILRRETTIPRGRENNSVRKKMAQVLPSPSTIVMIIVKSDMFHLVKI